MKANDTSKVMAISIMRTCEPAIQGYLGKLPTGIGVKRDYQERYFVLSSYYLAYYAGKPENLEDNPKGVYDLRNAVPKISAAEFELGFPHDNSVLKLRGRSGENAKLWVDAINTVSTSSGTPAAGNASPPPEKKKAKGKWKMLQKAVLGSGGSKSNKCEACNLTVYPNDPQLRIDANVLHKVCFEPTQHKTKYLSQLFHK
jgi:hypothetical protein